MITEKISNSGVLSGTINASSNLAMGIGSSNNLVGGNINTFTKETDPTIPDYIKAISKEDIAGWDNNAVVNEEQNKTLVGLEELIDTITPKSSEKGELIHTTDALPLPVFKTTVDGSIEQETTRGVNLIDKNNYILDSQGRVGIDTSNLVIGETYTFSSSVAINLMKISNISDGYNSVQNIVYNGFKTFTFTMARDSHISEETKQYLWIKLNPTTWATDISQLGDLQIEPGDTATEIEKFTGGQASPNSSYPQEIKVIEGYNLAKLTRGKVPSVVDGQLIDYPNGGFSDFIKVDTNERYVFTYEGNSTSRYLFAYDDKYNYLGNTSDRYIINTDKFFSEHPSTKYVIIRVDVESSGHELPQVQFARDLGITTIIPYGHIGYKMIKKNLLYWTRPTFGTVTENEDGSFYFQYAYTQNLTKVLTGILESGTYTITNYGEIALFIQSSIGDYTVRVAPNGGKSTFTYDGTSFLRLTYDATTVNTKQLFKIQLESGSNSTPYEPYQEQITYIDLKGNKLAKGDSIVIDKKGNVSLVKNVPEIVLDGSESWFQSSNYKGSFYARVFKGKKNAKTFGLVWSDYFIRADIDTQVDYINYKKNTMFLEFGGDESRVLNCWFGDENTTLEEWITWLSNNNMTLYYEAETPEIIDLGKLEEPIKTFEGINNIQLLANIPTEIEVRYALDVKKYADDRYLELTNALVSTGANL